MGSEVAQGATSEGRDTVRYKPQGEEYPGNLARLVGAVRERPGIAVPCGWLGAHAGCILCGSNDKIFALYFSAVYLLPAGFRCSAADAQTTQCNEDP